MDNDFTLFSKIVAEMFIFFFNIFAKIIWSLWPLWLFLGFIGLCVFLGKNYIRRFADWVGWEVVEFIYKISILYLLYLFLLYIADRENFWKWFFNGLIFVIITSLAITLVYKFNTNKRRKRTDVIIKYVVENNLISSIDKFIDEFGHARKRFTSSWNYRGYGFDYYRLKDLRIIFREKGLVISTGELISLLIYCIDFQERLNTFKGLNGGNISFNRSEENVKLPYRKKNDFLTINEKKFYYALESFARKNEYHVFTKVRLEDLICLPKEAGNNWSYRNRIKSRHVDFVLCDYRDIKPLIAIELDDLTHQLEDRRERDVFMEKAFKDADMPLLRFNSHGFYDEEAISCRILDTFKKLKK